VIDIQDMNIIYIDQIQSKISNNERYTNIIRRGFKSSNMNSSRVHSLLIGLDYIKGSGVGELVW